VLAAKTLEVNITAKHSWTFFINELVNCGFIKEKKVLIMLGKPKHGKNQLVTGLAIKFYSMEKKFLFKDEEYCSEM